MSNYVLVMDPIRSKNFAIITDDNGFLKFHPMNEMARAWSVEQKNAINLSSIRVPDGMYVSSPQKTTPSVEVFIDSLSEKSDISEHIDKNIVTSNLYSERVNLNKKNNFSQVLGTQIKKLPKSDKTNVISYKAMAFLGRARRSSVISTVKTRKLKVNKETAVFSDSKSNGFNPIEKSAGANFSRRVASSSFLPGRDLSNRLSRRTKSLISASQDNPQKKSVSDAINFSINSKAKRFL